MKTLILSANTGQGHNSCARAIQETFLSQGDECDIQDVFGLVSRKLSRVISRNHENTYRHNPARSDAEYRFLEKHPEIFQQRRIVYRVMSAGRKPVAQCIRQGGYDAVICTHVLAAMILTAAIHKERLQVQSAFVATDYSCAPGVNGTRLDWYFIPHPNLTRGFLAADVPVEKLIPTGIPVQRDFRPCNDKPSAKATFGIAPGGRHLLMMCGSMGCGPIPEMLSLLAARLPESWEITVVCGTNAKLQEQLSREHANNAAIHIRGYENRMTQLLSSADLYLTKPGGLSTSEAAAANVPMVFVDTVSGCEANNLQHFVALGAAITGDTVGAVVQECLALMNDPIRLAQMADALRFSTLHNSAKTIWATMHPSASNA